MGGPKKLRLFAKGYLPAELLDFLLNDLERADPEVLFGNVDVHESADIDEFIFSCRGKERVVFIHKGASRFKVAGVKAERKKLPVSVGEVIVVM